jgi:L-alanine-DL-glutamate epimerase-like enolase superfamily enzyme
MKQNMKIQDIRATTVTVGHDPARMEEMRFLIANPTASLYNNRTQILAALEFACLDILGQAWDAPPLQPAMVGHALACHIVPRRLYHAA